MYIIGNKINLLSLTYKWKQDSVVSLYKQQHAICRIKIVIAQLILRPLYSLNSWLNYNLYPFIETFFPQIQYYCNQF